jgi:hypothetical protein
MAMDPMDLRRRSWRRAARTIIATVIAVAGATSIGGSASACSGPFVTALEAIEKAEGIALVRVAAVRGDAEFPQAYDFVVEEAYRGSLPPIVEVAAPQYHACGDRIVAATGDRLVIFFDVEAFTGQPPMNPYWRVGPGDALAAEGIDPGAVGWQTLDQLRGALTGEGRVEVIVHQHPTPEPSLIPVLGLLVAAGVIVFGMAYLVRR